MFANLTLTKILGTAAVAGGLTLTQLGLAGAVAAPSTAEPSVQEYPAGVVTDTDISLESRTLDEGESTTATVTVTSDAGTPQGRVTFKVSGHSKKVVPLVAGEASYETPTDLRAGRTYKVSARYNGGGVYRPSSAAAYITVRGDGEVAGREGEGGAGGDVQRAGALPSVGADSTSTLYALGGLGLLGAGAATLLVHRRRTTV